VTETTNQSSEKPWAQIAPRVGWAILIVATLYVCYFSHLGAIGFVGPDEPRYAYVARDMVETGDWVTPRLYGRPWFEKPSLYYWGAALCFKLFGVSEAAARLPSAISALFATLALAWLALRLYGAETARWLLLLLPTTVGMIGFSHAAATDMPFSGMLTIAMVAAAVGLDLTRGENTPIISRTPWLALLLFGFSLGLAVLAKGPAAIILCGGAVFFWALFTKRWRDAVRLLHPVAIGTFCLTVLPWYILCARRNPDFFRVFIIEHNFKRYLTPEFQHVQPFWYYIPVLLIIFLPWTAILVWTLAAGSTHITRKRQISAQTLFLLCWGAFCLAFFTISLSKLPGYILPAAPAVGLILARSCTLFAPENRKSFGISLLSVGLFFIAVAVTLQQMDFHFLRKIVAFEPLIGAIFVLLALSNIIMGIGFLFVQAQSVRVALSIFSLLPMVVILADAKSLASDAPLIVISPQYLASTIRSSGIRVDQLSLLGVSRSTRYGLNFYLHTELKDWNRDFSREALVLSDGMSCEGLRSEMVCLDMWPIREAPDSFGLFRLSPPKSPRDSPRCGQPE
jgi:4-amino-4-deoxy-L-arabinose transferase-like glycosyltransferase